MVAVCTSCNASYKIDASRIPDKGASFRCKKCKNVIYLNNHKEVINAPPLPVTRSRSQKLPGSAADYEVIDVCLTDNGTKVEVLQFPELLGSNHFNIAENLFYLKQSGLRLKMVKITVNNSHIRVEPGALYFMKGALEMKASTGGGIMKGLSRKMLSKETFFVNEIHGTGEIFLEPTFGHFLLYKISKSEKGIITDKSMFYAGTAGLEVSSVMQKNISSALLGGEGLFQTCIRGSGVAVLFSPVPSSEINKIQLKNEKLWIDGNFALMRSEDVHFKAEKSSKSWLSTSVSGERLLQTFEGIGNVWIAPTQGIYENISSPEGIRSLALPAGSSNTNTKPTSSKRK